MACFLVPFGDLIGLGQMSSRASRGQRGSAVGEGVTRGPDSPLRAQVKPIAKCVQVQSARGVFQRKKGIARDDSQKYDVSINIV